MRERMTQERAELIAINGLAYLAGSTGQLDKFLSRSGMDAAVLRREAGNPDVLRAILDYLLTDDELVGGFCQEQELEARDLHLAHHMLAIS